MLLNHLANRRCAELLQKCSELRIEVHDNGLDVPVIDCGVEVAGSLEAGLAVAETCMSGLGRVGFEYPAWGGLPGPAVVVRTDDPVRATLASQYAGWSISVKGYTAMGSGPMRAAAEREALFEQLHCGEDPNVAVGFLEAPRLPPAAVGQQIAAACELDVRQVTLLVAPTSSIVGSIQVVARSVETALHKLHQLDFDVYRIVSGIGSAPMPPVGGDDLTAMGRTNDAVLYGGDVTLWVRGDNASLEEIVPKVPSGASPDFGRPFLDIFEACHRDFYLIDPLLFSPARITLVNVDTGHMFSAGRLALDVLRKSFAV
jgi:methenyltetrahydromethanopterin cyclohydrolase